MQERKKVCIITMNNPSCNFGNKLQNYASTVVLNKMGFYAETLAFLKQPSKLRSVVLLCLNKLSGYHFSPDNAGIFVE